jgi:hypothetical protein
MPVEVIFFNVGQGDCTFLWFYQVAGGGGGLSDPTKRVGAAAVLIDCGTLLPTEHRSTHGVPGLPATADDRMIHHIRQTIADRLGRNAGAARGRLDYLFLSHPDADHHNRLGPLLCNAAGTLDFTIQEVWYTGSPADYHRGARGTFTYNLLEPGQRGNLTNGPHSVVNDPESVGLGAEGQRVEIAPTVPGLPELYLVCSSLYAQIGSRKETSYVARGKRKSTWLNAASLVFLLNGQPEATTQKRQRLLLMADAERGVEDFLRESDVVSEKYKRQKNMWLKAGHHGSAEATGEDWLRHITPDALFFSSGRKNFGGTGMPSETHLTTIRNVMTQNALPDPVINPTQRHPYGFFKKGATPPFTVEDTNDGICTALAEAPPPGAGRDWLGVDWHLILDDPNPGDYHLEFV